MTGNLAILKRISHDELVRIVRYDPDTGLFWWLIRGDGIRYKNPAGCKLPRGYISIQLKGVHYYAHRLAWFYTHGVWPEHHIDHINGVTGDNRLKNLRLATGSQNNQNMRPYGKLKGVSRISPNKKWRNPKGFRASIRVSGKNIYLGCFKTPEDAHAAYCTAAIKYFGEFARLK